MDNLLVTGGAGFIGSNFIINELEQSKFKIINLDLMTYAGNPMNLKSLTGNPAYIHIYGDIGDSDLIRSILIKYKPCAVINFAAESHVDRSIRGPGDFVNTNIVGTFHMLQEILAYWEPLLPSLKDSFRFLHVSTDEVFGSLNPEDPPFHEGTPYAPTSPYAASKASSDHLVRTYHHTYGLPTLVSNCSNNYGPRQFPEKLIPLILLNALNGRPLPIYGDGRNVRDWLYVEDHCEALRCLLADGRVGESYNIGGRCEMPNIEIVKTICALLDEECPNSPHAPHSSLISFIKDRPGHDRRYAVDCSKIERETGWRARETLATGLMKTIRWYLRNPEWVHATQTELHTEWVQRHYGFV